MSFLVLLVTNFIVYVVTFKNDMRKEEMDKAMMFLSILGLSILIMCVIFSIVLSN